MECHPHSPTSHSVVDYTPTSLKGKRNKICRYFKGFLDALPIHIYHEILTLHITEILSTINPSVWETLPVVVVEILSTESTISRARPLSLAAPFLSYRNKLRHLPIWSMLYSILASLLSDTK